MGRLMGRLGPGSAVRSLLVAAVVACLESQADCGGCPARRTFGIVGQHACGGSTWFGELLDEEPCSQGYRDKSYGHADGAYRYEARKIERFALPVPPKQTASGASSKGALLMPGYLVKAEAYLRTQTLNPKIDGAVVLMLRDPLFITICEKKKAALKVLQKSLRKTHPEQRFDCDPNHQTKAKCGFAVGMTFAPNVSEFMNKYDAIVHEERQSRNSATRLAHHWNTSVVETHFKDLLCTRDISAEVREVLGLRRACRRRRVSVKSPLVLEKLSPPNPAAAMTNRAKIAAIFIARGFPTVAGLLNASVEADCAA